jgi:hypothetical protein|tara:strand:+ start:461 stop:649 length:189 start_codon:yes stop_codon:yes gene_type:complete
MPILNETTEVNAFLNDFSIACNNFYVDEHIALENENIRKQLATKENYKTKLEKITAILKEEF